MPRAKRATAPVKAREPVARMTLYLDLALATRLDLAHAQLRGLAGEHRSSVTARMVIETALSQALADYETNGASSALATAILERVSTKKP